MAGVHEAEQDSRRESYRAGPPVTDALQVSIVRDDVPFRVELIDLTFSGAGFALPEDIVLEVGSTITLQFEARDLPLPASCRARVRARNPYGSKLRYGVEFYGAKSLQNRMPARLHGSFNRRRSFRIIPDSTDKLDATVTRRKGDVTVVLPIISLSASGCAMIAKSAATQLLMTGDVIIIRFVVPGTTGLLALVGNVRYGQKQRGGTRYGVEFDIDSTTHFKRQQKVIQTYVMEQQRKMVHAT
ncbi:MAG: hypothetical protein ACI9OJ_002746 [Myxococcota bacterium]|jgi:hypothetical protein